MRRNRAQAQVRKPQEASLEARVSRSAHVRRYFMEERWLCAPLKERAIGFLESIQPFRGIDQIVSLLC